MKMKTMVDIIRNAGRLNRGIRFVDSPEKEKYITYDELFDQSRRILSQLQQAGIGKGTEVILQLPDNYSFICCFWACILGGIIAVPVPKATSESEYYRVHKIWDILDNPKIISNDQYVQNLCQYLLDNKEPKLAQDVSKSYINCSTLTGDCEPANVAEVSEDDIAYLQFSSGSTGDPKGVTLIHGQIIANLEGIAEAGKIDEKDSGVSWMPLTHDMGIVGFHFTPSFLAVDHCLVTPAFFVSNPLGYLELIDKYRYTVTGAPNFGYALMTRALMQAPDQKLDLSCLRLMINGAEPISIDIAEKFCAVAAHCGLKPETMYPVYGLAEAVLAAAFPEAGNKYKYLHVNRGTLGWGDQVGILEPNDPAGVRVISEGKAVKYCAIRITDKESHLLQEGYAGQIMLKGRNIIKGYYKAALGQNDTFDDEGWYKTGDIGFIYNGEVYVVGRIKDIIFSNGRNFYADAMEKHIESVHPTLSGKVVICGINDFASDSDRVVAFLVFEGSVEEFTDTALSVKNCISEYFGLIMEDIVPIKEKYATMSGKLQRFKYAERYQNGEYRDVCVKVNANIDSVEEAKIYRKPVGKLESELHAICLEILGIENISTEDNFSQIGANSIKIVELYNKVCAYSGKNISVSDIYAHPTIKSLASYLDSLNSKADSGVKLTAIERRQGIPSSYESYEESFSFKVSEKIIRISEASAASIQDVFICAAALTLSKYSRSKNFTVYFADNENLIHALAVSEDMCAIFLELFNYIRVEKNSAPVLKAPDLLKSGAISEFYFFCTEDAEILEKQYKDFDMAICIQLKEKKFHLDFVGDVNSLGEGFYASFRRDFIRVFTNIFIELESNLLSHA